MEMPGRTFVLAAGHGSRYGFNGKEKDPTEFGALTHYDYGFRIYNPAIAKFLSVDPLKKEYPELTPYQFASNTPIQAIDLDGLEAVFAADGSFLGQIGDKNTVLVVVNDNDIENVTKFIDWTNNATNEKDRIHNNNVVVSATCEVNLELPELYLRATLTILKQAEAGSANPPLDYNDHNNGEKFTDKTFEEAPEDYAKHPGKSKKGGTAAGAYQFLKRFYKGKDFSPAEQDKAAVGNMTKEMKVAAKAGNVSDVKDKFSGRWISLKHWDLPKLEKLFKKAVSDELNSRSKVQAKPSELNKIK
jgi:RHS repeat-associated protein